MSERTGLFEIGLGVLTGIAGGYIGYRLGGEAVEYARTITETPDVIAYMINQHPNITKLMTILAGVGTGASIGRISGTLVDIVCKTRF